jgi:hypothetical protein
MNQRKKAERINYILGEIKSYEDLIFVMAHSFSEEGWIWFYEPEMLEGNEDLVKLMGTIEGIGIVLSLFGISEALTNLIIEYYACPYRRKSSEDFICKYLFEQHVPWPCIDILSLIRKPSMFCEVEEALLKVCRIINEENM